MNDRYWKRNKEREKTKTIAIKQKINEIFRRLIDYNNESDEKKKNLYCCLPCSSHTKEILT